MFPEEDDGELDNNVELESFGRRESILKRGIDRN